MFVSLFVLLTCFFVWYFSIGFLCACLLVCFFAVVVLNTACVFESLLFAWTVCSRVLFSFFLFCQCSTSLPGGNQVDGLPPASSSCLGTSEGRNSPSAAANLIPGHLREGDYGFQFNKERAGRLGPRPLDLGIRVSELPKVEICHPPLRT